VTLDRRWDTDFLTVSHLIKSNTLGRVIEFESHFDRWEPKVPATWKGLPLAGGGAIYNLGTHLIDQVVEMFGMPKRITAFITSQKVPNPSGFQDSFTCLLHYDGLLATVKAAAVSAEVKQLRFWIRGEKGSFKKVSFISNICSYHTCILAFY
jgi:predicted dehydrogenase